VPIWIGAGPDGRPTMGMLRQSSLLLLSFAVVASACDDTQPVGGGGSFGNGDVGRIERDAAVFGDAGPNPDPDGGPGDLGPDMGADAGDMGVDMGADPFNEDNARRDQDCDGLSDEEEFGRIFPNGQRTDPENADSDGDGVPDGVELGRTMAVEGSGCPPLIGDADPSTTTSPVEADSDGDGIADGAEDRNGNGAREPDELDPRLIDTDGDGLEDGIEDGNRNGIVDAGELDGTNRDSDGDGLADGVEDQNRDGVFDAGETDPRVADTDGDGLLDGEEDGNLNGRREPYETDPTSTDTDCDGISDGEELMSGTSPLRADSDGDGLADGLELGLTMPLPGSNCPAGIPVDLDPTTTTDPTTADTDGDGLSDGEEDVNGNGRVDPGESDPNDEDSDDDGLDDGDEVLAGFDPTDAASPEADRIPGILQICADTNLEVVDFDEDQTWTLSTETRVSVVPVTVLATSSSVAVSALNDGTDEMAGFVLRMPLLGGAATGSAQAAALDARVNSNVSGEGLARQARVSGRNIVSHDGYSTVVSALYELEVDGGTETPAEVRNRMIRLVTGLDAADFGTLPTFAGTAVDDFVYAQQLLVRDDEVIVVGALLDLDAFDDRTDNRAIAINDLVNGSALAERNAPRGKDCDPFLAEDASVADFIWMADISGSTNDDRGRIVNAANLIVNELTSNNVDFRLAVVPHTENDFKFPNNGGDFRGVGFTTNPTVFAQYLQDTSGSDGCEFGLEAASNAIDNALPRSAPGVVDPQKLRDGAALAVVYITDEYAEEITDDGSRCFGYDPACDTGIEDVYTSNDNSVCEVMPNSNQQACIDSIVQPYIDQLVTNNGTAFAQVILPQAMATPCTGYACTNGRNEPGLGYTEVVNATGGAFYTPCSSNPGPALQSIVDAVAGAASQYQLTGDPISSTLRVGVIRLGQGGSGMVDIIPRDRDDGFDYDAASNSIFFRGFTYRPNPDDIVVISYRNWEEAVSACGNSCALNQTCDEDLGVCVCDAAVCGLCGPNQVCDENCDCACTSDCNGNCGPGETCDPTTCTCECGADCGGACGTGTSCDASSCSCVCEDCGGACAGSLTVCNDATCACECPADCGGACGGNTSCNTSLCECVCDQGCDAACSGNAVCDPSADCACVCPDDCGGCVDGATCNSTSCACECPTDCGSTCSNNEICDPAAGCGCVCPDDCGGCSNNETCDPVECRCVPVV